jgi:polyhydroxyalkanoate synthesis regulator phasin
MVEKPQPTDAPPAPTPGQGATPPAPRRGPGHRGADMRDTVAEMAERAQLISQEAGSKIAGAMKDVIAAAAGLAGFAIESARDLVQYMVRRGQMTQEEADRIIRDAEEAHGRRSPEERARPTASKIAAEAAAAAAAARAAAAAAAAAANPQPAYTPPPRMAPLTTGRGAHATPSARPATPPRPAPSAPPAATPATSRAAAPASKGAAKRATGKTATKAAARSARPARKTAAKGSKAASRSTAKKGSKRR